MDSFLQGSSDLSRLAEVREVGWQPLAAHNVVVGHCAAEIERRHGRFPSVNSGMDARVVGWNIVGLVVHVVNDVVLLIFRKLDFLAFVVALYLLHQVAEDLWVAVDGRNVRVE